MPAVHDTDFDHKPLRRARKSLELTQEQAAKRIGIPTRTYQSYERGDSNPPWDRAKDLRDFVESASSEESGASTLFEMPDLSRPRIQEERAPYVPEGTILVQRLPNGTNLFVRVIVSMDGPPLEADAYVPSSAAGAPASPAAAAPGE